MLATPRYVSGSGLKCWNRSDPKIMSQGMPANFAMLSSRETFPVRQRTDDEAGLQTASGPGRSQATAVQPVPSEVDMNVRSSSVSPALYLELCRPSSSSDGAVKVVEPGPGQLSRLLNAIHRRVIRRPAMHRPGPANPHLCGAPDA